jgi:formate dehydrogenase major subunit
VKGRYGWDYAASPQRLTTPLIRVDAAYPKGPLSADVRGDDNDRGRVGGGDRSGGGASRATSAAAAQARRPGRLRRGHAALPGGHLGGGARPGRPPAAARSTRAGGPGAIAGFGSAKCSNEEAYLFQKLIRTGFSTNNVDHCTRLCHASSVAALFEGVGSGAVSTTYGDVANADVVIITGSNPTANHPVASSFFKQARRRGTKVIYVDPRATRWPSTPTIYCQLKPGTDVAFYNAIMHEVIRLGLIDREFIATARRTTTSWPAPSPTTRRSGPRRSPASDADTIREVARAGARRRRRHLLGMGISQHTTGTDNARCLIALCSITGNVGRAGHRAAPACGARTTCRARRTPG